MGAFLLVQKGFELFDNSAALSMIGRQCGTVPQQFDCGNSLLWLFPRRLAGQPSYHGDNSCRVFVTGTAYMPGHTTTETIILLHRHFSNGNTTPPPLRGHYAVIVNRGGSINLFTDSLSLMPVYRNHTGEVMTSSFLALCDGLPSLTLSPEAAAENLLTGVITGNETLFREISKVNNISIPPSLPDDAPFKSRKEAVDAQIETLDEYFSGMKAMVAELGADTGLTGGYDSRLLLAFCLRHFDRNHISLHSHLRSERGSDYEVAEVLAGVAGMPLKGVRVTDISDHDAGSFENAMDEGMLFSDGQVRSNLFWFEDFTTARYRLEVLGCRRLGLSGIGGEMYRNMEGLGGRSVSLRSFIRFDLVGRNGGTRSAPSSAVETIIRRIGEKIISSNPAAPLGTSVNLTAAKRYLAEIYNPAGRAIRVACENRISWFLCPFADVQPVATAIRGAAYLGTSMDFEAEMIARINPALAGVVSGYGYPFTGSEPRTKMLKRLFFRNMVPGVLQPSFYDILNRNTVTRRWRDLSGRIDHIGECMAAVTDAGIPVNASRLVERTGTGPLVIAIGHLIKRFSHKITQ